MTQEVKERILTLPTVPLTNRLIAEAEEKSSMVDYIRTGVRGYFPM